MELIEILPLVGDSVVVIILLVAGWYLWSEFQDCIDHQTALTERLIEHIISLADGDTRDNDTSA